jgi:hypothetical protein
MSQSNACLKMANPSYFKYTSLKRVAELYGVNVNSKRARTTEPPLYGLADKLPFLCGAP